MQRSLNQIRIPGETLWRVHHDVEQLVLTQVVQMLIDAGADTYLADSRGQTAWDYAQADSGARTAA